MRVKSDLVILRNRDIRADFAQMCVKNVNTRDAFAQLSRKYYLLPNTLERILKSTDNGNCGQTKEK